MMLSAGARLGPYEIEGALGAGGMGEVYRARDTRLDRTVAVKVLPAQLTDSPAALSRFEREAKAVAALTHPNILSIFDFGREGADVYAVMELLEGETLRQKLAAGIGVRKAIEYGVQIARGLAAAHGKGVVHRDLKPENVFVTVDGRIKILDFGLARQTLGLGVSGETASPTVHAQTDPGTVLGTVGYMSPEQARGESGDHRSDLFSFGALMYELVSGRRAFHRATAPETLTAILRDDPPDLGTLASGSSSSADIVPPALGRVIQHCLEKNPAERFQSASDVAFALEALSSISTGTHAAIPKVAQRRPWLPWTIAAILGLLCVGLLALRSGPPTTDSVRSRLSVHLPKERPYASTAVPGRNLALSPDGRTLVYVAPVGGPARRQLFVRSIDRLTIDPIAGTEGAYQPFFSPDGKWIAFFTAAGELKKVSPGASGPPVTVVRGFQNGQWSFGAWRDDDTIVFSAFENLLQVPAAGGTSAALTTVDGAKGESYHQFPQIVPGTGDVLFTVGHNEGASHIEVLRWDTKARSTILDNASVGALTSSGHVLFSRDGALMAAAFDAQRRTLGPAVPLPDSPEIDYARFSTLQLAASRTGTLAYVPTNLAAPVPVLGWMDRSGTFTEIGALPKGTDSAALSPDGQTVVVQADNRVFLFDMNRRVTTPVDIGRRITESVGWHPDNRRLTLGGPYLSLFDIDSGKETRLTESGRPKRFATWSPDGRVAAYMTFNPAADIHLVSLEEGAKPRPFLSTGALEYDPAFSPDGHWLAYRSTVAGDAALRTQVFVIRFPEATGRVQITNSGGGTPFWRRDGRELFFTAAPGVLQAVPVTTGDRLQLGEARTLFSLDAGLRIFGPSQDGLRFLVGRVPVTEPATDIVIVQNWFDELRQLVPRR